MEELMYANILIPTDGSELSGQAAAHGIALAKRLDSRIALLTVLPPFHVLTTDTQMIEDTRAAYQVRMLAQAETILGAAAQVAQSAGVACATVNAEHERPYQAIINTAESSSCDLIVMASHGRRGVAAILIGSETLKVLTHCRIPVLVHRQ
jgi:nucleotide-binding universal stress UspA family protein